MKITEIAGGVTAANGFKAAGVSSDIKGDQSGKKDVAIIASDHPCQAAGCYTQNKYAAAPVAWCRSITHKGQAQAIVINSGNANACTGEQGLLDTVAMADLTGAALGIEPEQVLVCSTGVIGVNLPMQAVEAGIGEAVRSLSAEGAAAAAQAIMTTDTYSKEFAVTAEIGGTAVKLGGMAKGSGMIHPDMATMLAFITTDAVIDAELMQMALSQVVQKTFNMVTVDGDTSTNDSLIILANGMADNQQIKPNSLQYTQFCQLLERVCLALAKMMAKDGEGATKLLEVRVKNAVSWQEAAKAAKAVVASSLVKAAFFGEDANWGRIICALGYSGAQFAIDKVEIALQSSAGREVVMKEGRGLVFDEENAAKVLAEDDIIVEIDLHDGSVAATAWGCDLSYEYVRINGCYRT